MAVRDRVLAILSNIHMLLHPEDVAHPDGRVFRFVAPNANELLRELARRIRAIPDDIAAASREGSNPTGREPGGPRAEPEEPGPRQGDAPKKYPAPGGEVR